VDERLKQHPLGFWEIAKKPTSDELQKYYANKYYQEANGSYELEYTQDELNYFKAKLEQRMAVLKKCLPASNGEIKRMLDVGCGEGYALAFFREQGWIVKGIDFSSAGVDSKNPACRDVLETGDVFDLLNAEIAAGKTYDVVWLQNVLEHVIDPLDLLNSLRALVSPDGVAVVTVPNDCSITQRALLSHQHIDTAFWVAPPDHLTYFDHVSLENAAQATGWECAEILGDFPVDWFLFHPNSNYVRDKSVGKSSHKARVQIENLIHEQPIEDVLRFWSATAKLGIGRDITAFLRPMSAN
jgi:2-polyprenyl-3-methyl-5-hydroxy-6-metoxy-1,4-benzoquinol methylase